MHTITNRTHVRGVHDYVTSDVTRLEPRRHYWSHAGAGYRSDSAFVLGRTRMFNWPWPVRVLNCEHFGLLSADRRTCGSVRFMMFWGRTRARLRLSAVAAVACCDIY